MAQRPRFAMQKLRLCQRIGRYFGKWVVWGIPHHEGVGARAYRALLIQGMNQLLKVLKTHLEFHRTYHNSAIPEGLLFDLGLSRMF